MTARTVSAPLGLPPVQITLPKHLLAPLSLLATANGSRIAQRAGSGWEPLSTTEPEVTVTARPQLRLWALARFADIYGHEVISEGRRGLRLVPVAEQLEQTQVAA